MLYTKRKSFSSKFNLDDCVIETLKFSLLLVDRVAEFIVDFSPLNHPSPRLDHCVDTLTSIVLMFFSLNWKSRTLILWPAGFDAQKQNKPQFSIDVTKSFFLWSSLSFALLLFFASLPSIPNKIEFSWRN